MTLQRPVVARPPGAGARARKAALTWTLWLDGFQALSLGRRNLIGLGAGALSTLAMAPFHLWPMLWGTFPVLWLSIEAARPTPIKAPCVAVWRRHEVGRAAEAGWWFGFGYHLVGLFWIGEAFLIQADVFAWLLPFAVTLLPAGLALYTALAAAFTTAVTRLAPRVDAWGKVVVLAIALSLCEWLRGHVLSGFPWNVFGYALTSPLSLMQSAAVFGIYGLTVVVVMVFAGPFALLRSGRFGGNFGIWRSALALMSLPFVLMLFGSWRLADQTVVAAGSKIRLVQASIPQRERMQMDRVRAVFDRHIALSLTAPDGSIDGAKDINLVIWPEAAMQFVPLSQPVALAEIGQMLPDGALLASGALRVEGSPTERGGPKVYNSLEVFAAGDTARLVDSYDKMHLVPFGEYLPKQGWLEAIGLQQLTRMRGGFASGAGARKPLVLPGIGRVLPLICYEIIFPSELASVVEPADVLLNITNDGWFGTMTGPYQHYHQARVRAVEEGIPLIRASNNGISALVDAKGREIARLGLNVAGTLDFKLPATLRPTPYARFGDEIFLWFVVLLAIGVAVRASHHVANNDRR